MEDEMFSLQNVENCATKAQWKDASIPQPMLNKIPLA